MVWTVEKLEEWKAASGKSWGGLAHDLGVGERHLRKIRHGQEGKKGLPTLEKADRVEYRATARLAVEALQAKTGQTRAEIARGLGVGERQLRKMLSLKDKDPREGMRALERLFGEAARQGLEPQVRGVTWWYGELATNRIAVILEEMFLPEFKGLRKSEIDRLSREMFDQEHLGEGLERDTWRIARDIYAQQQTAAMAEMTAPWGGRHKDKGENNG